MFRRSRGNAEAREIEKWKLGQHVRLNRKLDCGQDWKTHFAGSRVTDEDDLQLLYQQVLLDIRHWGRSG